MNKILFGENVSDVVLYRPLADKEFGDDLFVGQSVGNFTDYLPPLSLTEQRIIPLRTATLKSCHKWKKFCLRYDFCHDIRH